MAQLCTRSTTPLRRRSMRNSIWIYRGDAARGRVRPRTGWGGAENPRPTDARAGCRSRSARIIMVTQRSSAKRSRHTGTAWWAGAQTIRRAHAVQSVTHDDRGGLRARSGGIAGHGDDVTRRGRGDVPVWRSDGGRRASRRRGFTRLARAARPARPLLSRAGMTIDATCSGTTRVARPPADRQRTRPVRRCSTSRRGRAKVVPGARRGT